MARQIMQLSSILLLIAGITACTLEREGRTSPSVGAYTLDVHALDDDGENRILLSGRVVENVRGCEIDVACLLRIEVDGLETSVVYHYGEWPPCENTTAIRQGQEVEEGELVDVYAGIIEGNELTTCNSSEFYIRHASDQ